MKKIITTFIFAVLTVNMAFAAPTFKDVSPEHWAYEHISSVAEKGYITGDTTGNFKPDDNISKFETSKILARVAGYKYYDITPQEQTYFDRAYEKNKTLIAQYAVAFSKWNSTTDREIAFLLEKEILTTEDLNQFIIKDSTGKEQLRALSMVECAEFLVRLIDKKIDALTTKFNYDFADDASIPEDKKQYVYYLKSKGVISADEKGNFNPYSAVNRASISTMLNKALNFQNNTGNGNSTNNSNNETSSVIETITGTVDKYYSSLNAVQIITFDGKKNLYKISPLSSIYIDTYLKTPDDLKEGMPVIAIVNENEVAELKAQSISTGQTTPSENENSKIEFSTLEGTITATKPENSSIIIEIRMLNPLGEVITEQHTYTLASNYEIFRGDKAVTFENIRAGDIAKIKISGNRVYSINLQEKELTITGGTLLEKRYNDETNTVVLSIESKGKKYSFRVTNTTTITRKGSDEVRWSDIRIGDGIDIVAEYDRLIEVYAYGARSTVDGWIEEIKIGKNESSIILRNNSKELVTYNLITNTVDAYELRLGNKVRLRLDSNEVETVVTLEQASSNFVTGYISSTYMEGGRFELVATDGPYGTTKTVSLDSNTVIINATNGDIVSRNRLKKNMKVYVTFKSGTSYASTITILSGE